MWFSVVCTLMDNDTCHHSGQNLLWTHSAAPRESTTFWPLWWCVSLSIRVQITLNHILLVTLCYWNWDISSSLKSLLACMQTSRLEPILLSPWSRKLTIIIIQLSYTAQILIFWLVDLYHMTLVYVETIPLMSLLWCYNSHGVDSTHHCHYIHWPQSKMRRKCQANFSFLLTHSWNLKKIEKYSAISDSSISFHIVL